MIDWLDPMARAWAAQRRAILHPRPETLKSMMGKLGKGFSIIAAAEQNEVKVHAALTGTALEVHVAIQRAILLHKLTERQYQVFFAHYVCPGPPKQKAHFLGMSRRKYYDRLDSAHHNIACYMEPPDEVPGHNLAVEMSL